MMSDTKLPGASGPEDGGPDNGGMQFELTRPLPLSGEGYPSRSRKTVKRNAAAPARIKVTARDRLLILDLWQRSKLPATEFCRLVGMSSHTLYAWRRRFEEDGPAGLEDHKKGRKPGSRMPETTRRVLLMMKASHPEWGVDRLHDMLLRSEGFKASASAIALVLSEEGYEVVLEKTRRHPDKKRRFERAKPNQLWQTDLFTFMLKRENRRLYLVAFMDDHSRFITAHGLNASSTGAVVRDVFLSGVANFGVPVEVLTDQGPQYHTWRGKSAFTKLMESRGVKQILARARHPQTLGKIERFWGTLWRECVSTAIFRGLDDARTRIGHFVDYYNFKRTHQGIDGMVPADRFFSAAPEVKAALEARVVENAAEIAKNGQAPKAFYLTGKVGEQTVSLHAEGEKMILTKGDGAREEVSLTPPLQAEEDLLDPPPPGTSPVDDVLTELADLKRSESGGEG